MIFSVAKIAAAVLLFVAVKAGALWKPTKTVEFIVPAGADGGRFS